MIVERGAAFTRMLPEVARPLAIFAAEAVVAAALQRWTRFFDHLSVPDSVLGLIGTALGIVIAFRTNAAYARWWEARRLWGGVANASRTFARRAIALLPPARARAAVHGQIAYAHAPRRELRGEDAREEATRVLGHAGALRLAGVANVPAALLLEHARACEAAVRDGELDRLAWQRLDATLADLTSAQGGLERIKGTPLPLQFDLFPELFIFAYCALLPVTLVDSLRLVTPLVTVVIAFAFLVVDAIGNNLEDPFDGDAYDVAMTNITQSLERVLRQQLGEPAAAPSPAVRGVLM